MLLGTGSVKKHFATFVQIFRFMMLSMTGYGKAELNLPQATFTIEVRSLNSKQLDAHIKMSSLYRDKEIGLRKRLAEKLVRGKN